MSTVSRVSCALGSIIGITTVVLFCTSPRQKPSERQNVTIGPLAESSASSVGHWIAIEGDKVTSVSQHFPNGKSEVTIGSGLYATPGLVDMHVHIPPRFLLGNVDLFNLLYLTHGVTSIREMGTIGTNVHALASAIQSGSRIGPRIFTCGTPLSGSPTASPFAASVENAADIRSIIDKDASRGADCIKLYRGFPESLLNTAVDQAEVHNVPLVGHLPLRARWEEKRIADIQHICDPRCFSLRDNAVEALIRAAQSSEIRHTPTLVAFNSPLLSQLNRSLPALDLMPRIWSELLWAPETLRILGFHAVNDTNGYRAMQRRVVEATKRLASAGATIQTGSDSPHPFVVPGASLHHEMKLLLQAGLSPDAVWQSATQIPGGFLSLENLGVIQPGAPADILLFREDPTLNLNALDSLEIVIAAGRVYRIDELRQRLQEQIEYIEGPLYQFAIEPVIGAALQVAADNPQWLNGIGAGSH